MITNHESLTLDITEDEKIIASVILARLKTRYNGRENAITGGEIVKRMKDKGYAISQPRLRKCINFLRQLAEPIIGTSNGYYFSSDHLEIEKQIVSLGERADAILAAQYGLKKYLNATNQPTNINGL